MALIGKATPSVTNPQDITNCVHDNNNAGMFHGGTFYSPLCAIRYSPPKDKTFTKLFTFG